MAHTIDSLLALLEERKLLNRITKLTIDGIELQLDAAPAPMTPADSARAEARRDEALAAWERRMRAGAVGAFVPRDPLAGGQ